MGRRRRGDIGLDDDRERDVVKCVLLEVHARRMYTVAYLQGRQLDQ
jgi:hypothetical protein